MVRGVIPQTLPEQWRVQTEVEGGAIWQNLMEEVLGRTPLPLPPVQEGILKALLWKILFKVPLQIELLSRFCSQN